MLVALASSCASSKSHPTTGKFEDCYYDCKPGQTAKADPGAATPGAGGPTVGTTKPSGKLTPANQKAQVFRDAADLIDKAQAALDNGNKNLADQYFSSAELLTGPEALAQLAPTFREGAPPRVTTPTEKIDTHVAPQPKHPSKKGRR